MSLRRLFGNSKRVLIQLKHDPRSMALIILAPCFLMTILKWVYSSQPQTFQLVAGSMLGIFPMLVMFLITSVATLRERISGTLERLLISPLSKVEFILGYAIAFGFAAFIQSVIVSTYACGPLGLHVSSSRLSLIWVAILDALLGVCIGLLTSSFAQTEFQALQFMPAILLPQFLISGLLVPRATMPRVLLDISNFLPLSYAMDATQKVLMNAGSIARDSSLLLVFIIGILFLGSLTLKRTSK
ncbi:MAG TPA: ABC transporter permease [Candidatus Nanopelagicaceae bacterium]|nr:ABC transporter permease [Candidatus Nanopelagicaceae bacterium]